MQKNNPVIPETFHSKEDIQDFWDTHSTSDFDDVMEEVDFELSPELKAQLETKKLYRLLNFDSKQIADIEAIAKTEKIDSREIMRKWILEHV